MQYIPARDSESLREMMNEEWYSDVSIDESDVEADPRSRRPRSRGFRASTKSLADSNLHSNFCYPLRCQASFSLVSRFLHCICICFFLLLSLLFSFSFLIFCNCLWDCLVVKKVQENTSFFPWSFLFNCFRSRVLLIYFSLLLINKGVKNGLPNSLYFNTFLCNTVINLHIKAWYSSASLTVTNRLS